MRRPSLPSHLEGPGPDSSCSTNANGFQDIVMSSDGEPSTICPPPPHIAARFYRPTSTRRKSSTASSRRNSITSLHSNRSNRSAHGGPYSTHIAQHLRRASIIESRKARLADKAAHAEKVRLRAALAKAAPRISTVSESRAAAAQQARERYLAQVAANCAEEVKRAKKIAEDMKERKAAEHLKLKEDIEEKLAEVERRRLMHQQNLRRNRSLFLPVAEEKKTAIHAWKVLDEDAAAKLIQRAWRSWKRRQIVSDFLALDLTIDHVKRMSFEETSDLLAQEKVLSRTARMLQLCELQDGEGGGLGENTAVRMFLSTFLILGHPTEVLSNDGEQEQDLIRKARILISFFENLFSGTSFPRLFVPSSSQLASFVEAYSNFQTVFTAWRNRDSSFLVETMVAQFVELDAIWQTVKNDVNGEVAADYKEGIQQNQTLLLVRLKRLAGTEEALKLVNEAVRARRRSKTRRRPVGDVRPRAALRTANIAPVLTPSVSTQSTVSQQESSASDRSLQANELQKVISPLPDNRTLIHELAINKDYRLDVNPRSDMRNTVNRAVFQSMRNDLAAGVGDEWVVSMAQIIRDRLLHLVTPGKSLHVLITETLDPTLIEQQLNIGNFSYEKFFSFINTILPKLCAPIRDFEVKALAADQSNDFIERLAKLMHIIDLLSLDYANYLLQASAPELLRRAAEYEQRSFTERMGNSKLIKTLRWWSHARAKGASELSRRAADASNNSSLASQPTSDKIYSQGLIDLFISFPPLLPIDLPETLELDQARVERIRTDVLRITAISTILLTAKNLLKRDVRSQWKSEAQRMWDLPEVYRDASQYLSIIESSHVLPSATRSQLQGTITRVLSEARASPDISHPVMKVLLQKMKAHVMNRLSAASAEDRLRNTTTASEVLAQGGMAEFVAKIGAIVDEMGKVKAVDWEAHGMWLDEVAKEVGGSL
ncbi:MAG: hypothetical protein Q9187_002893 [Circinaria calcarea]